MLDGVYRCGANGTPNFIDAAASTDEELHALLQTVIARFMKMLTRRGVLVEEVGQTWLAEPDTDGEETRTVRPPQAADGTTHLVMSPLEFTQRLAELVPQLQLSSRSKPI